MPDEVRGDPVDEDESTVDDPWANLRTKPKVDKQAKRELSRRQVRDVTLERQKRMVAVIDATKQGALLRDALAANGVAFSTYQKWRQRYPHFGAEMDIARSGVTGAVWNGSHASFASRYFGMDYAPHHLAFINELEAAPLGSMTMGLMPPDHGKGHPSGTILPTPDGWTTIDDLKPGDLVIGVDGVPTTVVSVFPWRELDCYELEFSDGSTIRCDGDHLWFVSSRNLTGPRGRYGETLMDTRRIAHVTTANARPVLRVPVAGPFDLPDVPLDTDPYLLGLWLGDGFTATGDVCAGHRDLPAICAQFDEAGYPHTVRQRDAAAPIIGSPRLRRELKALGVIGNKHIPPMLLRGSYRQRLSLLQGLIDSDGHVHHRQAAVEYSTIIRELADGVYELVRTLGVKARLYEGRATLDGRDCGPTYRVVFYPGLLNVARLERKLVALHGRRQGDRHRWETIVACRAIPSVPTKCIKVEATDGLYLVGAQMHTTHNTTMGENYMTECIARDPQFRITIASANLAIAKKILGRVRNRLEPSGPYPAFVREWGPFVPQVASTGAARRSQPWSDSHFNVFKKKDTDERDYTCQALGYKSEIVSTRCDYLHLDDLQSLKNLGKSGIQAEDMARWVRQDALSRPGQHGKTGMVGTRVGPGDVYEHFENDPALDGILKVIKFPAIITDHATGEQRPLWPERYNLDQLDRQRRLVGEEAWDRNYMQNPGASESNATFTTEIIDRCKHIGYSLRDPIGKHGPEQFTGRVVYVGLDPALGGKNCVIACEVLPEGKLLIRRIVESVNLRRNEDIMADLNNVVTVCNLTGMVTDVVIESMNFQRGLARDERLIEMQHRHGFACREHLTGWNKYDDDIGVASMVSSFSKGEIILPWSDDPLTRHEIEELVRQLRAWRPGQRGTKLRQDRVMALWFVWIVWRQRWKQARSAADGATGFKRKAVPSIVKTPPLLIPIGATL